MTPEQAQILIREMADMKARLDHFELVDRFRITKNIELPTDIGVVIGTTTKQKLAFFGKTPIVQWSSGTGRQDLVDNTGADAKVGFRATGNIGSTGYSLGDLVARDKTMGLLAP